MPQEALGQTESHLRVTPTNNPPAKETESLVIERRELSLTNLSSVIAPPDPELLKLRGDKKREAVLNHIAAHQNAIGSEVRFKILHKLMVALENKKINFNFSELRGYLGELDTFTYKRELVHLAYELSKIGITLKRTETENSKYGGGLSLDWFKQGDLVSWEAYSKAIEGKVGPTSAAEALECIANLQIPESVPRHRTCGQRKGDNALNELELVKVEDLKLNPITEKTLKNILKPDDKQTMVVICQTPLKVAKVETKLLKGGNEEDFEAYGSL